MADSVRPIDQKSEEEGLSAHSFIALSPVVTNGVVIDLYKKNKKLSWRTVVSAYKEEIENDLNESGNNEGLPVFDEEIVHLHKSCVFDSLLQTSDHEFDVLTQQATELICSAMLLVLENQCEESAAWWQILAAR